MAVTLTSAFKTLILNIITGKAAPTTFMVGGTLSALELHQTASDTSPVSYQIKPLGTTFLDNAIGGTMALSIPDQAMSTVNGGVSASFSWHDSAGTAIMTGDVGLAGSGAAVILSTLSSQPNLVDAAVKLPSANGALSLSTSLRNTILNFIKATGGTSPNMGASSTIKFYTGTAPATADLAATGTLLATFTIGVTNVFNMAAAAEASLTAPLVTTASNSGTIGYARWEKGALVMQMSAGTAGTNIITDSNTTTAAAPITINTLTLGF